MSLFARVSALVCTLTLIFCCLASQVTAAASEAVRIEVDFEASASTGAQTHVTFWLSPKRVRIEQRARGHKAVGQQLLYQADFDRLYSISDVDQEYIEVDRDLVTALGIEVRAARREMNAQLAKLPRDQRAAFERLLGVNGAKDQQKKETTRIVATDQVEIVNGHKCRQVTVSRSDDQTGVACVVPYRAIGLTRRHLEVFRQLANFQRELMGARGLTPLEMVPNQPLDLLTQFDGFPLYLTRYASGGELSRIRVTGTETVAVEADFFELPAGYNLRGAFTEFQAERPGLSSPARVAR